MASTIGVSVIVGGSITRSIVPLGFAANFSPIERESGGRRGDNVEDNVGGHYGGRLSVITFCSDKVRMMQVADNVDNMAPGTRSSI